MSRKINIDDESLADGATEPVADEALTDATAIDEAPAVEPEDFDLAEWLEGIGPARFAYPLDGRKIEMQARTLEWSTQLNEQMGDADDETKNREFLAGHFVDERITGDALKSLQVNRPIDFADMLALAIQIDTRPSGQVQPRFLLAASD